MTDYKLWAKENKQTTITFALKVQQALNDNSIFHLPENAQILSWVFNKNKYTMW